MLSPCQLKTLSLTFWKRYKVLEGVRIDNVAVGFNINTHVKGVL